MFCWNRDKQVLDDLVIRIAHLESTVVDLAARAGIEVPPGKPLVSQAVRDLVEEGKPIAAIKRLREETGLSLSAAKRVVDGLQTDRPS
ncbi:hypothetical protein CAPI_05445 [Corynebacterium capitovis DSM 44611]|uniref:hypothetical protein n=1 Tax=Corynebacterium capitovis TaxID=131081 RepID=UPI00036A7FA9|nr:hypothetical protein [Corynebacterium capitovis]WKD57640.1 hypothetical protein CAPI_05445 [Corynebacterium capitovis DSM 44611]